MRTIGTELARIPNLDTYLGARAGHQGASAQVVDPASLISLLSVPHDDNVSLLWSCMTARRAMEIAVAAHDRGHLLLIDENNVIGSIRPQSIRKLAPGAALAPSVATALRARLARLKAQEQLDEAVETEAQALLALAA